MGVGAVGFHTPHTFHSPQRLALCTFHFTRCCPPVALLCKALITSLILRVALWDISFITSLTISLVSAVHAVNEVVGVKRVGVWECESLGLWGCGGVWFCDAAELASHSPLPDWIHFIHFPEVYPTPFSGLPLGCGEGCKEDSVKLCKGALCKEQVQPPEGIPHVALRCGRVVRGGSTGLNRRVSHPQSLSE